MIMDRVKGKWKKNVIFKALERCRFSRPYLKLKATSKSPSKKDHEEKGTQIAPHGCFSVHVGAERQRFVVKTKYVNHPLFQMLLEEAEQEYGFESDGPIWLPCNVDLFYKVLAEIYDQDNNKNNYNNNNNNNNNMIIHGARRSFAMAKVFPFFVLLRTPARVLCYMDNDHSAYSVMDSELSRMNRF